MNKPGKHNESGYLQVFQEITRLISGVQDPQEVMNLVVCRLPELLQVDAATIRLLDRGTNRFVLGAARGVSDEYLSRSTIDTVEVMQAWMDGRPTACRNMHISCDQDACAFISKEGVKSALSLPIKFKGEITGLLRLLTRKTREFSDNEIDFAMSLAEQVGIAIAGSQMFQELENQVNFFTARQDISRLVNSTLDLDDILNAIVDKLPGLLGVKGCTIRLLHPATNRLELAAASGLSEAYLNRGSISREDSSFKVLKGKPVAIYDAPHDMRVDYHEEIEKEGIKSILAAPIKNGKSVIGVLRLLSDTHRAFTASDIRFVVSIAEESGIAIEKARLYRKITLLFNQIEENERFLQTILDSLWMELLVVDPDKRIIMANNHFLKKTGLAEKDVLGQPFADIAPQYMQTGQPCPLETVLASAENLTVVREFQAGTQTKWFKRHLVPIVRDDGRVEFVVDACNDITDQIKLKEEHARRIKLQGVVEMAGTAAHKINSPLFAALGTSQLLREDLTEMETREDMDLVISNLQKIKELTRDMIHVTGFSSSEYAGNTQLVELETVTTANFKEQTND
jgi:PAS domain S-box-containing protein